MSDPTAEGHPIGSEVDDTPNPTAAAPDEDGAPAGETSGSQAAGGRAGPTDESEAHYTRDQTRYSRDMLQQLQEMIDSLTTQAGPLMRDVAAKAAELAAVAGQRAGPLAHRAAEATERVGVRVATRSREMATDLRRRQSEDTAAGDQSETPPDEEKADG